MSDHWYGCWQDGPGHYACAVEELKRLRDDAAAHRGQIRDAMRYRWLRDAPLEFAAVVADFAGEDLDRYIDAQMDGP